MPTGRAVLVKMTVSLLSHSVVADGTYCCLKCGGELELHQPDIELPDRLLATCGERCQECGSWHLMDYRDGPQRVVAGVIAERRGD